RNRSRTLMATSPQAVGWAESSRPTRGDKPTLQLSPRGPPASYSPQGRDRSTIQGLPEKGGRRRHRQGPGDATIGRAEERLSGSSPGRAWRLALWQYPRSPSSAGRTSASRRYSTGWRDGASLSSIPRPG